MATNLKELNKRMRQAKKPVVKPVEKEDPLPALIEKMGDKIAAAVAKQVTNVNVPEQKPRAYRVTIDRSSKDGKMLGAKFEPIDE